MWRQVIKGKLWAHEVQTFVNRYVDMARADREPVSPDLYRDAIDAIATDTGFSREVIEELYYGKVAVVL